MLQNKTVVLGCLVAWLLGALGTVAIDQPAYAQNTLSQQQCRDARAVALATLKKYDVSAALARSFANFAKNCDLSTKFDMVPGTDDEKAFGEFRIKMVVIRS